jgi:hypothetical protein
MEGQSEDPPAEKTLHQHGARLPAMMEKPSFLRCAPIRSVGLTLTLSRARDRHLWSRVYCPVGGSSPEQLAWRPCIGASKSLFRAHEPVHLYARPVYKNIISTSQVENAKSCIALPPVFDIIQ